MKKSPSSLEVRLIKEVFCKPNYMKWNSLEHFITDAVSCTRISKTKLRRLLILIIYVLEQEKKKTRMMQGNCRRHRDFSSPRMDVG